jgi:hypothetical protein
MRLTEPTTITKGESLEWQKTFCDYPASEWTLEYRFRGVGPGFNATATADGDDFAVTVPASDTDKMDAGKYQWQAWATNIADTSKVKVIGSGFVTVKAGFSTETGDVDLRSDAKKVLDAINAMIQNRATDGQLEYEITTPAGSRRIKRMTMTELLEARKVYAGIVARENAREKVRRGGKFGKTIGVRLSDG